MSAERLTASRRRVSPETIRLLAELAAQPSWPARILGRAGSPQHALDAVVASGEVEAAFALLPIALTARDAARGAVLGALDRLVRALALRIRDRTGP